MNKIVYLIIIILFGFASPPRDLLNSNSKRTRAVFKANGYSVAEKQFQFLLKNSEKVRFIITPPHYGVRTAIGVATDGSAEKIKVLIYKLNNKQDQDGELINATMDKEEYRFWELEHRASYFMIEIQMLVSSGGEYGSYVELVHGFKDIPKENPVSDFRYHTNEGEKPTGELAPPCLMPERHFSCTPNEKGYIHRIE